MQRRYYHASRKRFKVGDLLIPGVGKPNFTNSSQCIYLTENPNPHYTVKEKALEEGWFVYEVVPTGNVYIGTCWDEYWTEFPCEIIKTIGNVRGISKAGRISHNRFQKEYEQFIKDKLEEIKVLDNEELKDTLDYENCKSKKELIKKYKSKLQYKNAKTSKAFYPRFRY